MIPNNALVYWFADIPVVQPSLYKMPWPYHKTRIFSSAYINVSPPTKSLNDGGSYSYLSIVAANYVVRTRPSRLSQNFYCFIVDDTCTNTFDEVMECKNIFVVHVDFLCYVRYYFCL